MADDDLIAGAAAPTRTRRIRSAARLDAMWVVATAGALLVSSVFDLVDLRALQLRTGAAPLRVFVIGLPLIAIVIAAVAARRRHELLSAAATGVLAPGVALAGSLSIVLFLDDGAAFADIGVAISLAAAVLGAVMLARWFVYHPAALLGEEPRPIKPLSLALTGIGVAVAVLAIATGVGGGIDFTWVAALAAMNLVPLLSIAAGLARTVGAAVMAASSAAAQMVAVLVTQIEPGPNGSAAVPLDSDLALGTGVIGLVGLGLATGLGAAAALRAVPDDPGVEADDDASWRWSPVD